MQTSLSISRLIDVAVNLAPLPAQMQNLNNLLLLGSSHVINVVERQRSYASIDDVVADFGTSGPEYLAAVLWFEQAPQPTNITIGRWAKDDTQGALIGGGVSAANQLVSAWTGIATGAFKVAVNGGAVTEYDSIDFTAQTTLQGVAGVITTALTAAGITCTWNSVYKRFEFKSATTGLTSAVSFLTAPASGVDISAMLAGLSTSSGAYVVAGIAAETALAAATLFDTNYGQSWYALQIPEAVSVDHLAVAAYIESTTSKHIYGVTSQEAGMLSSGDTTNIGYLLKQLGYKRSMVQYSSTNAYAVASALARILTTDYNANNSVITLMYKQEPGIVAEQVNATQANAIESFNANVFLSYNNNTAIFEPGVMASGEFVDTVTGADWLALAIQTALYNLLYTSSTKIPQTDAGNHLLVVTAESICSQAVVNGLLAPGYWTVGGFGSLNQGDYMPKGFYVYAPPISQQSSADRAARKSVTIQIAAKLAGAIHNINVIINVNR